MVMVFAMPGIAPAPPLWRRGQAAAQERGAPALAHSHLERGAPAPPRSRIARFACSATKLDARWEPRYLRPAVLGFR